MDSANGKNGEKDCILHHTVEMKQSHPMTEPTRKGREHFSAFSLFIIKCLKGITGLGCVFSVLQHTENELQRKNGEQANGNQMALLGGVLFERSFIAVTNFSRHRMMEVSMMAEE